MEKRFFIFFFIIANYVLFGQEGQINGDFNLSLQSYQEDILIDAQAADEIVLSNAYLNLNYTKGNFRTGIRYESYLNALADFDPEFKGNGIPFKYAIYKLYDLEITAGNFYEQFGTGLIFRSYEEKGLGIDNAMDGVRLKYDGLKATNIKGFIGKSRTHFTYADGIFRGIDGEVNINELFNSNIKTQFSIGGSFISRYQERSNIVFKIPQNVGAYATRLNVNNGGGLFRMTSANIHWGYNFSSSSKSNDDSSSQTNSSNNNDLFGGSQDFSDRRFTSDQSSTQKQDEAEKDNTFYSIKIPWKLNVRHSLTYSNARQNRDISNNSLMVSGSVGLTPKWDVGVSTGYDFKNKGITYTNFRIERDLDSWVMNLAWTPFGTRQSWFFFIGVRSGFLSDLKYDKRREPDKRL